MSEKRGNTGKLKNEFPDHAGLFIKIQSGRWVQVTPVVFRSWTGERKYSIPSVTTLGNTDVKMEEVIYEGPVYLFESNTIAEGYTEVGLAGTITGKDL